MTRSDNQSALATPAATALCVLMTPHLAAASDVILLRNGTIIKGKYVGGTSRRIWVDTPNGLQFFDRVRVQSITCGDSPPTVLAIGQAPPATDAEGTRVTQATDCDGA